MKFSTVLFVLAVLAASSEALPISSDNNLLSKRDFATSPLGGIPIDPVTANSDGTFDVAGSNFKTENAAHQRQCDRQKNACFNKFNGGDKSFSGQDCENQHTDCINGQTVFAKGASPSDVQKEKKQNPTNFSTNPLGDIPIDKVTKNADGTFDVAGSTFQSENAAHQRQCDRQKNACFNKFNGGDKSFSGQDCENQHTDCINGQTVFA